MAEIKRTLKWFDITEYEKEAVYLREMHKQGWKYLKATIPGIYKFEKCEPEDVVYQLDYNQDGSSHKAEYIQMFADCGWEYIGEFVGYSYFRKPLKDMNGEEEIFNDNASKIEMLDRVYKGRMLPLIVVFFCLICPQLITRITGSGAENTVFLSIFGLMFILYIMIFYRFTKKYKALKEKYK